jgi:hypothetical protein
MVVIEIDETTRMVPVAKCVWFDAHNQLQSGLFRPDVLIRPPTSYRTLDAEAIPGIGWRYEPEPEDTETPDAPENTPEDDG